MWQEHPARQETTYEAGPDSPLGLGTTGWRHAVSLRKMTIAFVLGGGGLLGAHEVGMLRALSESGIRPDLVVGTSIGAVNGVFIAADPDGAAERLADLWQGESLGMVFSETVLGRAVRLARSGTHLHAIEPLRRLLAETLRIEDFADLELPFHCVAASIEHATAHWFSSGPVVSAVMASCAIPGLLPPVEIDGAHYFDGGLVDSIPVGRAVALGAGIVYVLQVGRIDAASGPRAAMGSRASRVRDRAGTGSTRRCRRFRPVSRYTSCPPEGTRFRRDSGNSVTGAEIR